MHGPLNLRYLLRYLKYVKCSDFEPISSEIFSISQEIANIVNTGNSGKNTLKKYTKNGTIYVLPQTLRFLYIVGAKDKQVLIAYTLKKNIIVESPKTEQ
jgi:hypothetical protein